jgi:hypothetical protein
MSIGCLGSAYTYILERRYSPAPPASMPSMMSGVSWAVGYPAVTYVTSADCNNLSGQPSHFHGEVAYPALLPALRERLLDRVHGGVVVVG